MFKKLVNLFSSNHLLTNFIFILVFISGIYFWNITNKEELPSIEFDVLSIRASFPGASPEDVEHFITKPIENTIKGMAGILSIRSTSYSGSSSIFIEIDESLEDKKEVINDIRNNVLAVALPDDAQTPTIRQFKTSQRAILDIGLINENTHLLNLEKRQELQKYALALENQLLSLREVNDINLTGYLQEEIRINLLPDALIKYDITINNVVSKLRGYNLRQPIGSLENEEESEIIISDTDYGVDELNDYTLRGSYKQPKLKLGQIAKITREYTKNNSITKINGKEAIILNVTKSSSTGIIVAIDEIMKKLDQFRANNLKNTPIKIVALDDSSQDVRSRLRLISYNGIIGFVLILLLLFIFLDFRSGFWVAMGIPFTFCITMIVAYYLGFTINNITLAGVIIVMGMIVDDAIVVAESIVRLRNQGIPLKQAVVDGTISMSLPVTASILTTCVAFFPLLQMDGKFAKMIIFIPSVVIIMPIASLFESLFILPAHMNFKLSRSAKIFLTLGLWLLIENYQNQSTQKFKPRRVDGEIHHDWFYKVEDLYSKHLQSLLRFRYFILVGFLIMVVSSFYYFTSNMKFVMFPNEESTEIDIFGSAPEGTKRLETAILSQEVEAILSRYLGTEVVGFRTQIALSRWGNASTENSFRLRVELLPYEQREKSLNELIEEWNQEFTKLDQIKININKKRFGHSSGSPLEIVVLDNNEENRNKVVEEIYNAMKKDPSLFNVMIDEPLEKNGYELEIEKNFTELLGIEKSTITSTLRTILTGNVIESIPNGDEEIDLIVTLLGDKKKDLDDVLKIPISGKADLKFPLKQFVKYDDVKIPTYISRESYKRITRIYAENENLAKPNFNQGKTKKESDHNQTNQSAPSTPAENSPKTDFVKKTPLQIAEYYEANIFPSIISKYPTSTVFFDGEVKSSRSSQSQFKIIIFVVIFLIYMILALLFHSMVKPFLVMIVIPFGIVGVIIAYFTHGIDVYGFFAMLGILGLSGVVVNDTIIMIFKYDEQRKNISKDNATVQVAEISKTRIKAIWMTTLTTVAGLFPTAYGIAGYDSMLAEMMFTMGWGLIFATFVTLLLLPTLYNIYLDFYFQIEKVKQRLD